MTNRQTSRRGFLATTTSIGAITAAGCAGIAPSGRQHEQRLVRDGAIVLLQGDSITDAGRDRKQQQANSNAALGKGYAWLSAMGLLLEASSRPETDRPQIHNRGISGNKVFQLRRRWQQDCIDLKPDLLSILIGVNDIWHTKSGKYDGTVTVYERDYDELLAHTLAELPDVRLVVCEPFVLRCGAVDDSWFPEFDEYRAAARRVAGRHGATLVLFQDMFDEACRYAPPEHWAKDGVHPSEAGAAIMAQTWLRAVLHG
jgi:lysophospholipase L1-like esterase